MRRPLLLLFALLFSLGACDATVPGLYSLQTIDDEPLPALFMGTEIIAAEIQLNDDGTCLITSTERRENGVASTGTDANCTWTQDGAVLTVTDSNAPLTGSADDDRLTLTTQTGAVFGLTRATASIADVPAPTDDNPHRVTYVGTAGPGVGKHVVLIAGDHEYRSEEVLPAMGRILAQRYGFKVSVFFTLDDEGFIEPGSSNMRGLEALKTADLMVVALRFQDFPDAEMQHIVDYLDRGGPVMGLRTATHAFRIEDGPFVKYTWNYEGEEYLLGFGRQVLGETWAGHYGTNHEQSSRVIPLDARREHPILRGVADMHVQSGGYEAAPMPGSVVLAVGQVLDGMSFDAPAASDKALMPVVWTRSYEGADGTQGRVVTTTHGASQDFLNDGFRRLLVNGALWALGMENVITPTLDVSFVGTYTPSEYGFDIYRRGVRPADMAGWNTPIIDRSKPTRSDRAPQGSGSQN